MTAEEGTIIKGMNIDDSCNTKCENCEKYFDCELSYKVRTLDLTYAFYKMSSAILAVFLGI